METELGANFQSGYTEVLMYSGGVIVGSTLFVLVIAYAAYLFVKRRFAADGRKIVPFRLQAVILLIVVPVYGYFTLTIPPRPVVHALTMEDDRDVVLNDGAEFFAQLCAQGYLGIEPQIYGVSYGEGTCENSQWLVPAVLVGPPMTAQQEIDSCVIGFQRTSGIMRWGITPVRSCLRGEIE